MKQKIILSLAVCMILLGAWRPAFLARAATGSTIDFSAYVVNEKNKAFVNGEYDVRFAIYTKDNKTTDPYPSNSDTSSMIWSENQRVRIYDGHISVVLGGVTPFPGSLNFSKGDYYFGIRIGTDSEMIPRKKIGSVPSAVNASFLNGLSVGTKAGDIAQVGAGGTIDLSMLPIGKGAKQIVVGNDNRLHVKNTDTGTSETTFNIGDKSKADGEMFSLSVSGESNKPSIRFNGTNKVWEYSNDGSSFSSFYSPSSSAVTGIINGGTGTSTQFLPGSLVFAGANGVYEQNNQNLFWDNINNRLGIGTSNPLAVLDMRSDFTEAVVGPEMIVNSADHDFSNNTGNWSGVNWEILGNGVAHCIGNAGNFVLDNTALVAAPEIGKVYRLTFDMETFVAGQVSVYFGSAGNYGAFEDVGMGTKSYVIVFEPENNDPLLFSASTTWQGTISNVHINELTVSAPSQIVRNADGSIGLEIRAGGSDGLGENFNNVFIGNSAGMVNVSGQDNTAVGVLALANNTTGSLNSAFGKYALNANTIGRHNAAFGRRALESVTIGSNNSGFGNYVMDDLIDGENNTAIGQSSFSSLISGNNNIAIGWEAGSNLSDGDNNIVIGSGAQFAGSNVSNQLNIGNVLYGDLSLGRIGIGTDNPTYGTLDVRGSIAADSGNGVSGVYLNQNGSITSVVASNNASMALINSGLVNDDPMFYMNQNTSDMITDAIQLQMASGSGLFSGNFLNFYNEGNQVFKVDSGGGIAIYNGASHSNTWSNGFSMYDSSGGAYTNIGGVGGDAYLSIGNDNANGMWSLGGGDSAGFVSYTDTIDNTQRISFQPDVLNDPSATSYMLDTSSLLTSPSSRLLSIRNQGTEKFAIGPNGEILRAGAGNANFFFGNGAGNGTLTGGYNVAMVDNAGHMLSGGQFNTLIGPSAGYNITDGRSNLVFGNSAAYNLSSGDYNVMFGEVAGFSNTTGSNNFFAGKEAGYNNADGNDQIAVGYRSGYRMVNNGGAYGNVALGNQSLYGGSATASVNTGYANVAIGYQSMYGAGGLATQGFNNFAVGMQAGYSIASGTDNTFFGYRSGFLNSSGVGNFFAGNQAGFNNVTGNYNIALGSTAGFSNTDGSSNFFAGNYAGYFNQTGVSNILIGDHAGFGRNGNSFSNNIFLGYSSGQNNRTGNNNVFIGYRAGDANAFGSHNTFIGDSAGLSSDDSISYATAIGYNAQATASNVLILGGIGADSVKVGIGTTAPTSLFSVGLSSQFQVDSEGRILSAGVGTGNFYSGAGTGSSNVSGTDNFFAGAGAGMYKQSGNYNTMIGYEAGRGMPGSSSAHNVFLGYRAGFSTTIGGDNFIAGNNAGYNVGSGSYNTIIGYQAGLGDVFASYSNNIFLGQSSGYSDSFGGDNNIFLGYRSGYANTTGNKNIFIGYNAGNSSTATLVNAAAIGYNAQATASNVLILGGTGADLVNVGIGTTAPTALLHLVGSAGRIGLEVNSNETVATNNVLALRSDVASSDDLIFRIQANGAVFADGAYASTGADYAEYFYTKDTDLKAGEAVCIDSTVENGVKRCQNDGDNNIMGIVSSNPSIIGNKKHAGESNYKIVGMLGQVTGKVSSENGIIKVGDSLTAGLRAGEMRKAKAGESTVGVALQNFSGNSGSIQILISRRNQSLTVEKVEQAVTDNIAAMNIKDQVNAIITEAGNALDSQIANQSSSLAGMQMQLDNNANIAADLQLQMNLIKEQNQVLVDFVTALNMKSLIYKDPFGNLTLLDGKLSASEVETGVLTIKIADDTKPTIGTTEIKKITVDSNNDGVDDATGSDGKTVEVKTTAVTADSKIFISFLKNPGAFSWVEKVLDKDTGKFTGFKIFVEKLVNEDVSVNWWIVEEK